MNEVVGIIAFRNLNNTVQLINECKWDAGSESHKLYYIIFSYSFQLYTVYFENVLDLL